ncbi:uncharacterized protein [Henckelia pumila]|uniref:uncharacterized protein n=1 Tax=Henckelia pumila TaxID=405737 RepID=UPI003C6E6258
MAEKVTIMVLKVVDLQCSCCYKKIKKILCKFPQIRDQVYDEKANTVTITVVCCDPEKIRDKLCCKGHRVIKSIEIKDPPKPKAPEKPKEPVKPKEPEKPKVVVVEKPKEPEKPKVVVVEKPKEPEKPKVVVIEKPKQPEKPKVVVVVEKPKPSEPPPVEKPKEAPKPDPPKLPNPPMELFQGPPPLYPVPTCCSQCYGGHDGGPCLFGYGVPPPPRPFFEGYYGCRCGYGCGYGYGRDCRGYSRSEYYLSEENPSSCSLM